MSCQQVPTTPAFNPYPRSVQVGEFEVAIGGGIWVAIRGLYKAEVIHRRSWPTRESVELATLEWVSWFNHHRLLGPIGYIPPAEAEANYYRQLASQTSMVVA